MKPTDEIKFNNEREMSVNDDLYGWMKGEN